MASEQSLEPTNQVLMGGRKRTAYNPAEREFSRILQQRLNELLEGKRNTLPLLRHYPNQPNRLGVMITPASVPRDQLRLPVVEALIWEVMTFVSPDGAGGPVSQALAPDGSLVELQLFATKFPHIIIERTDCYIGESEDPCETTWGLRRMQNQRAQTQLNRVLDVANLAIELLGVIRYR
ncbi:hypothetical protein [Nitrolancea hollandica]|uniref:Uncharacterized protein n=1 Tax=Nitrolancea hollandica Lb TaxID=1129897 RepID=I4ECG3_9BACT|nr:hypothetical protein [Nitrolancea hollandica]CCF82375.1 hypothetical protein NITHO_1030029 [Nitrolancea hollandica Lb]